MGRRTAASGSAMAVRRRHRDRAACLVQLALAFCDIADRDDIHQAALRLEFAQQWIRDETARAARDPIFADFIQADVAR